MHKPKDKEKIKEKTLENMREDGTMNHLQAKYVSLVASSIKDNDDFELLKPYKTVRTDKPYLIASQIVLQYFKKKKLTFSFTTISDETNGIISYSNPNIVSDSLNIHSDDVWITELLNDWSAIKSTVQTHNKVLFLKSLQQRLDQIIPENEKPVMKTKALTPKLPTQASNSPRQIQNRSQISDIEFDNNSFDDFDDDTNNDEPKNVSRNISLDKSKQQSAVDNPDTFDDDFPYQTSSSQNRSQQKFNSTADFNSPKNQASNANIPMPMDDDSIHFDSDDADSMGFDEPEKPQSPPKSPPKVDKVPKILSKSSPKTPPKHTDDFASDFTDEDISLDDDSG